MGNESLAGRKYFSLSDEQKIDWLRLIRSQNVGPATFRDLISHFGSATKALEALPDLAKRGGSAARIKICSRADAEREFALAKDCGAQIIGMGEPDYPPTLRMADSPPPVLFLRGNITTLKRKSLAIVGSRNASITGMKLAARFASGVGTGGYTIVSGLARGIDTSAHKSALKSGTTAVFAGGVDHVFPEENRGLVDDILKNHGAIVSEMPISWQPRAKDFPRRNRIITGLAHAVLVVEAARRSGSLITARLAGEMGRTVLAVPGSPLDPRSEGTNRLIRDGATLVGTPEEVFEALAPLSEKMQSPQGDLFETEHIPQISVEPDVDLTQTVREQIIASLGPSPVHVDDVVQYSGASASEVQLTLVELSLAGRIERHPGGLVSLI